MSCHFRWHSLSLPLLTSLSCALSDGVPEGPALTLPLPVTEPLAEAVELTVSEAVWDVLGLPLTLALTVAATVDVTVTLPDGVAKGLALALPQNHWPSEVAEVKAAGSQADDEHSEEQAAWAGERSELQRGQTELTTQLPVNVSRMWLPHCKTV